MNYTEIIDAGVAYADRFSDQEVIGNLDLFLRFGEARLSRLLKVRKASVRAVLPTGDTEYYSLPPDYGGMRNIQVVPNDPTLRLIIMDYMNPRQMDIQTQASKNTGNQNQLGYYTIVAEQIQLSFNPSDAILEIIYFQRIPPLTAAAANNWVSDDHPDIYLALLMYEIELFVKNHEVASGWEGRLNTALNELETTDVAERWAGNPLATKVSVI